MEHEEDSSTMARLVVVPSSKPTWQIVVHFPECASRALRDFLVSMRDLQDGGAVDTVHHAIGKFAASEVLLQNSAGFIVACRLTITFLAGGRAAYGFTTLGGVPALTLTGFTSIPVGIMPTGFSVDIPAVKAALASLASEASADTGGSALGGGGTAGAGDDPSAGMVALRSKEVQALAHAMRNNESSDPDSARLGTVVNVECAKWGAQAVAVRTLSPADLVGPAEVILRLKERIGRVRGIVPPLTMSIFQDGLVVGSMTTLDPSRCQVRLFKPSGTNVVLE